MISKLIIFSAFVTTSFAFLFDLPGITSPARQQCVQCCAPVASPCNAHPQSYAPPPSYVPPPSYAPPPPSYSTPYAHRKRRSTISGELEASSEDLLCNSVVVKKAIQKNWKENEEKTQRAIHQHFTEKYEREMVILCTKSSFTFLASHDAEYCSVPGENFTCYAFLF